MAAWLKGGLLILGLAFAGSAMAQRAVTTVTSGDVAGLRDAFEQVNRGTVHTIEIVADGMGNFPPFQFTSDYQGTGNALPVLTGSVTFVADDPVRFVGNGEFRFLEVGSSGGIAINRGTYENFGTSGSGGLALGRANGTIAAAGCRIVNNRAQANGGAFAVQDEATLRITGCRFEGNDAQLGGAISLESATGAFYHQVYGSTFTGNTASVFGCDLNIQAPPQADTRVSSNTFDGDCDNVLVENPSGNLSFHGNTFAGRGIVIDSTATAEFFGNIFGATQPAPKGPGAKVNCRDFGTAAFESLGFNIANDASCGLDQPTDQPNTDPQLGPKTAKGTYTLLGASPAIDGGGSELVENDGEVQLPCGYTDGEGLGRPQDANGDGIYECDVGNFEVQGGPDLGAAQSGAFFDPSRSGEGAFVEILPGGQAFVAEFSYQPGGGGAAWILGVGQVRDNTIVIDEVLQPVGGVFGEGFDPDAIDRQQIGAMSLIFSNCESTSTPGRLAFQADPGSPFEDLLVDASRLSIVVPCTGQPHARSGRSGSFFDLNRSGEGIFVQWITSTRVLIIWYTFDPQGNQMWIISDTATVDGDTVTANMLYPTTFTGFGRDFDPSEPVLSPWGTITLEYDAGCNSLELSYDSVAPGYGSGSYDYTRLTALAGTTCDL